MNTNIVQLGFQFIKQIAKRNLVEALLLGFSLGNLSRCFNKG